MAANEGMSASDNTVKTSDGQSADSSSPLVYAFGRIGFRFVSATRRDSIKYQMGDAKDPGNATHILEYLDAIRMKRQVFSGCSILMTPPYT
jgi:hypothetical protein